MSLFKFSAEDFFSVCENAMGSGSDLTHTCSRSLDGHELEQERFRLDIGRSFFPMWMVKRWDRAPGGGCTSLFSEVCKT